MKLSQLTVSISMALFAMTARPVWANSLDLPFSRLKQIDNICFFQPEPPLAILEELQSTAALLTEFPHDAAAALVYQGEPQLALELLERLPDFQESTGEQFEVRVKVITHVAVALAETGRWEQAMALLNKVKDIAYYRDFIIWPTAFALVEAGQIDAALNAIALTDNEQLRGEVIAKITHTLALTGDAERALEVSATADTDFYQVSALTCIAVAISERQPEQAEELFQQATQIAQQRFQQATDAEEILLHSEGMGVVILGLTKVREFEQMAQVLDLLQISDTQASCVDCVETLRYARNSLSLGGILLAYRSPLDHILTADGLNAANNLVKEVIEANSFSDDQVRSVIAFVDLNELSYQQTMEFLTHLETHVDDLNGLNRGTLLTIATVRLAEMQEFDRALSTLERSVQTFRDAAKAAEIGEISDFYSFALLGKELNIAQAMIRAGDYQGAIAFIQQYRSEAGFPTTQAILTEYYARQLFQQGAYNRAFEIAQSLDDFNRARLLADLAEALATIENTDQAILLAGELQSMARGMRNENLVLSRIAVSFSDTEQFETALSFIGQIDADYNRAITLREIATDLIESNLYRRAATVIQQLGLIEHNDALRWQNDLSLALIRALVIEGQFDNALDTAKAITDAEVASVALKTVAAALANAGQSDQALTIVVQITEPEQILDALNSIAISLINANEAERGFEILNQALTLQQSLDQ